MKRVVVTGLGMISPVGLNLQESWKKTVNAQAGTGQISSFDHSRLSVAIAAEVGGFDPGTVMDQKEAKRSSRFVQFALSAAVEAVRDSGLDISAENSHRCGCGIGVGIGAIDRIDATALTCFERGPKKVSPLFIPYVITNMASGIVANNLQLKGPNICPATACASGTHAIGESWLYIKNGLADVMVCGGSEAALCELSVAGFASMKALSRRNDSPETASRPFDRDRDGFVMGEGAGILVLEDYERAKRRDAPIYAEILGFGMSADAYHITAPAPGGEGAVRCLRAALDSAQLNRNEVEYVNAHGTSTPFNDLYETQAIKTVFKDHSRYLAISSTKGVTGHCLGAAGGIEGVFLAKSIHEKVVPPTANLVSPDPECDLDYIPEQARNLAISVGISNSFGFGGTNASIVMGDMSRL